MGASFEAKLVRGCKKYEQLSRAKIEKTPEPMRPIQRLENGRFVAVYAEKSQCDFKGTLEGGRSIVFEAKHTDGDRIQQSAVTEKQQAWLDAHQELGALCFVMVSIGGRQYARVPWPTWRDMKRWYGRKYITAKELRGFSVPAWTTPEGEAVMFLERMVTE